MIGAGAVAAVTFTAIGAVGIEQVATQGPDLAGIALVITAVSGLIATVGALLLGLRRKPTDATELALKLLLDQQTERMNRDDPTPPA